MRNTVTLAWLYHKCFPKCPYVKIWWHYWTAGTFRRWDITWRKEANHSEAALEGNVWSQSPDSLCLLASYLPWDVWVYSSICLLLWYSALAQVSKQLWAKNSEIMSQKKSFLLINRVAQLFIFYSAKKLTQSSLLLMLSILINTYKIWLSNMNWWC